MTASAAGLRRRAAGAIAAALLLGTPVHGQSTTDPGLDRVAAAFSAAYNTADVDRVAAFFAEDAVTLPPNRQMTRGRPAIVAALRRNLGQDPARMTVTPLESAVVGERGYEVGTRRMTWAGGTILEEKYVRIWRRVGQDWKIAYWIWNRDTPAEPPK